MLPPLLDDERRPVLLGLVALALVGALLTVGVALLVGVLVDAGGPGRPLVLAALLPALGGIAVTTYAGTVAAERLGQHYVHEVRGRLLDVALAGPGGPSLGITIARTTNDLTAIRGWIAQGVAPLAAAVPLVVAATAMLGVLHWSLALAALVPVAVVAGVVALVSPLTYRRARALRRLRGRLASRITDTLGAREGIRAAAGEDRERRRLGRDSERVAEAAVARAAPAGVLRAAGLTGGASIAVLVVVLGQGAGLGAGALATGLTLAGALAAPLADVGRIAELRVYHRAAADVIGPHLADDSPAVRRGEQRRRVDGGAGLVVVPGVLTARAGDRIRLVGHDPTATSDLLRDLALAPPGSRTVVDGWECARVPERRRRELVGLAVQGHPVERGTVARAVRYRRPDVGEADATAMLRRMGLDAVVARLPKAQRTELRRGGEPLVASDRARLQVARAALGDPPLLLLDRIDADLDAAGHERLRALVDDHPGVVVFVSDAPERVATRYRTVSVPDAG